MIVGWHTLYLLPLGGLCKPQAAFSLYLSKVNEHSEEKAKSIFHQAQLYELDYLKTTSLCAKMRETTPTKKSVYNEGGGERKCLRR